MSEAVIWEPIPEILEITYFEMPAGVGVTPERVVKDYEIDFFGVGGGKIYLDEKCFDILPSHIMLRRPGQRCYSSAPYSCYSLTLGFDRKSDTSAGYCRRRFGEVQDSVSHPCFDIMPMYFGVRNASLYKKIFSELYDANRTDNKNSQTEKAVILTDLMLNLLTDSVYTINREAENRDVVRYPAVSELCEYIYDNINQKLSLSDMAIRVNLHPNYLHRIFKEEMNMSPNEYIMRIRIERASQLLANTDDSVCSVAEQCGFGSAAYFTKCFKSRCGVTPLMFRKKRV